MLNVDSKEEGEIDDEDEAGGNGVIQPHRASSGLQQNTSNWYVELLYALCSFTTTFFLRTSISWFLLNFVVDKIEFAI